MLYFAYGSNLDAAQLTQRCPSARFVSAARLPDYRLAFTRFSLRRQCGVLDIVPAAGSLVWGALFDLHEDDFPRLDRAEYCHRRGYRRIEISVARHPSGETAAAMTYEVVEKHPEHQAPSDDYLQTVLTGALACQLPPDYLATIRAIATGAA